MNIPNISNRVAAWVKKCFGDDVYLDRKERGRRFLEEVIELNQAIGLSEDEVYSLVSRVYSRSVGDLEQELGGVGVTLFALTGSFGLDFERELEKELRRIESKSTEHFRQRHQAKVEAGVAMAGKAA